MNEILNKLLQRLEEIDANEFTRSRFAMDLMINLQSGYANGIFSEEIAELRKLLNLPALVLDNKQPAVTPEAPREEADFEFKDI